MSKRVYPEDQYERTMLRLQKVGLSGSVPTKEHIIYLADEIEAYRKKIAHLEDQLGQAMTLLNSPVPTVDLELQRLKDAIVAQFLSRYAPDGRCQHE